jgi:hypothetical protein
MIQNYNEYLEAIKKKLDSMNKASGFNPQEKNRIEENPNIPSNDILDMIGNGAKIWLEKQKNQ